MWFEYMQADLRHKYIRRSILDKEAKRQAKMKTNRQFRISGRTYSERLIDFLFLQWKVIFPPITNHQ